MGGKKYLQFHTQYKDDVVRSVPVVDEAGREFQVWIEPRGRTFIVHASNNEKMDWKRAWASNPLAPGSIADALDQALAAIEHWRSDV